MEPTGGEGIFSLREGAVSTATMLTLIESAHCRKVTKVYE